MSDKMPEGKQINSIKDLINKEHLYDIKLQNAISREVIESINNDKKSNDAEAMRHNANTLNRLSRDLVQIFFYGNSFAFWIVAYILLNVFLYYCFYDEASFYIGLVDKIALFIIVCILGKFLKDNLVLFIEMFKK